MRKEMHVYVDKKMPPCGITEFWRAQQAVAMGQAKVVTNQTRLISKATCDAGYRIYLHESDSVLQVSRDAADDVGNYLRKKC